MTRRTCLRVLRYGLLLAAAVVVTVSAVPWWLVWVGAMIALAIIITWEDQEIAAFVAPGGGELVWATMQVIAVVEQIASGTAAVGLGLLTRWLCW